MVRNLDMLAFIESHSVVEIEYLKANGETCLRNITDVCISDEYGDNYIDAYCEEKHHRLTFKIERIVSIKPLWIHITNKDEMAPQDGLYIFECWGDNHLELEMYRMSKGKIFCKCFSDEFEHMSGWVSVEPRAYHYIGFYPNGIGWKTLAVKPKNEVNDKYEVVAYQKGTENIQYALRLRKLWPEESFINPKIDDSIYNDDYWSDTTFLASHEFLWRP